MSNIYFIGCDMGGWHGTKDGLAILKWDGSDLTQFDNPVSGPLFYPIDEESTVSKELNKIREENEVKIIIAIDGALAWPVKFVELVNEAPCANHLPSFTLNSAINNPYLYRETERFVNELNQSPLSAIKDQLGSNFSKGQVLTAWFKWKLPSLYRPPFDEWDNNDTAKRARYTLIEVYPAASLKSGKFGELLDPRDRDNKTKMKDLSKSDIDDAIKCAMTAVCYAKTVGILNGSTWSNYPDVYTPDAAKNRYEQSVISKEGWIFAPKK